MPSIYDFSDNLAYRKQNPKRASLITVSDPNRQILKQFAKEALSADSEHDTWLFLKEGRLCLDFCKKGEYTLLSNAFLIGRTLSHDGKVLDEKGRVFRTQKAFLKAFLGDDYQRIFD